MARKRRERGVHGEHQVGGTQQQHKDQDEARPGRKRRLNGQLLAGLDIHMEARVQVAGLLGAHGERGGQRERHDGAHDHGKLGTHKHGDDQSRADEGRAGEQRDAGHAMQALTHARNVALTVGHATRD